MMKLKFTFNDGLEVTQSDQFASADKPALFYGLSKSFQKDSDITATDSTGNAIKRKFSDVKKLEIMF